MKLIVAGATGFVATEVIRQSLQSPKISSVIALARRPVPTPEGCDASKLKSVVLEDFSVYPEHVKEQLAGADACIWTLAITPTKSRSMEWDEVRRVCHDYTMTGLEAMYSVRNQSSNDEARPFRFLYMSGIFAERDQTKTPTLMPQYLLMRGEVENAVLGFARRHEGRIEACAAKPGAITKPGLTVAGVSAAVLDAVGVLPKVSVAEVSAAMLDQVVNGFEKDPLLNDDLVRIGRKALEGSKL